MKLKLLLLLFFTPLFFFFFFHQSNFSYFIKWQADANFNWTDIRVIDMASGNTNATLFENGKTKFSFIDVETGRPVDRLTVGGTPATFQQNGVAVSSNTIS
jgi:hypothetical protein